MQRADFKHCLDVPVRWGDMDALGHVNNVRFMRYLESGRVAHFEDVLGQRLTATEGLILADIQCAFRGQLHYPATVQVLTRVSRIGNRSMDLLAAIYRQGDSEPVATSKAVVVWFDYQGQRPAPVPEWVRRTVVEYEVLRPEGA